METLIIARVCKNPDGVASDNWKPYPNTLYTIRQNKKLSEREKLVLSNTDELSLIEGEFEK